MVYIVESLDLSTCRDFVLKFLSVCVCVEKYEERRISMYEGKM